MPDKPEKEEEQSNLQLFFIHAPRWIIALTIFGFAMWLLYSVVSIKYF